MEVLVGALYGLTLDMLRRQKYSSLKEQLHPIS